MKHVIEWIQNQELQPMIGFAILMAGLVMVFAVSINVGPYISTLEKVSGALGMTMVMGGAITIISTS